MDLPGNGFTVLILWQDRKSFLVIQEHLIRTGFRVRVGENGWDALKQIRDDIVDIVVCDLESMNAGGCNFREKLLLDPLTRDVPFLLLASSAKTETHETDSGVNVDRYDMEPFDPVVAVARIQAILERRRVYEEMVRIDPLTHCLNRRIVEREIQEDLSRSLRYARMSSFMLIDIDDMQQINTDYGQALGDLLISMLGGVLISHKRTSDIVGRYRGDIFIVYLPETDEVGAHITAARIVERFRVAANTVAAVTPSLSFGVMEAPRDGVDFNYLYALAVDKVRQARQKTSETEHVPL